MEKAIECITKKYANFSDRASRSEYWYFALLIFISTIVLTLIDHFMGTDSAKSGHGLLSTVFSLAMLVPNIAVTVRRLHDVDKSGWWLLIGIIPIIGGIWLLVLFCTKGTDGDNRFGADPLRV